MDVGGARSVAEVSVRGVLNAPVDWRWSFSKSSCSSFGRRGGEGPGDQAEREVRVVLKVRRERWSWEGRRLSMRGTRMADMLFGLNEVRVLWRKWYDGSAYRDCLDVLCVVEMRRRNAAKAAVSCGLGCGGRFRWVGLD